MQLNAMLEEKIEPGRCFALVVSKQRALEEHGATVPADFMLVIGNAFAKEKLTVPVNLPYLITMLHLARPLRITVEVGENEDQAAIRALLPQDVDQGEEFEQVADAQIAAQRALQTMKGK